MSSIDEVAENMKKVLYITNIPAPYTVDFFNEIGRSVDLTVIFEGRNSSERDSSWEKFNALNFNYLIIKNGNTNPLRFPTGIVKTLNNSKYDLYIVGNYSTPTGMVAIMWLRDKKHPYAIHADGGIISKESYLKRSIKRFFIRNASFYFSSGRMTTDYFVHYGAKRDVVFEYPFSSVRMNQIRSIQDDSNYRMKLGLDSEEKIIVSVGQIIPRKGFDVLINAVSMIKSKAKLYIIGGEATNDLKRLISNLELNNVEFIPFLPFNTVLDYMAAADVFVLLTREDIWGLVINEALSMGTPIISTDKCVAAVEMIENGVNGYIVSPDDPETTASHIDYLLGNKELRDKMLTNNINKAKEYTIETMSQSYTSIISRFFEQYGT